MITTGGSCISDKKDKPVCTYCGCELYLVYPIWHCPYCGVLKPNNVPGTEESKDE
jgi:hypothetical protein